MNVAYLAISIDGFIAGADHDIEWLNKADELYPATNENGLQYTDFIAGIGCILMGRATFDFVAGLDIDWPYGDMPVLVATTRDIEPPATTVSSIQGSIDALLDHAQQIAGDKDVYVDGGSLVSQTIRVNRLDEMVLTQIPVALGSGIPLFQDLGQTWFKVTNLSLHNGTYPQITYQLNR